MQRTQLKHTETNEKSRLQKLVQCSHNNRFACKITLVSRELKSAPLKSKTRMNFAVSLEMIPGSIFSEQSNKLLGTPQVNVQGIRTEKKLRIPTLDVFKSSHCRHNLKTLMKDMVYCCAVCDAGIVLHVAHIQSSVSRYVNHQLHLHKITLQLPITTNAVQIRRTTYPLSTVNTAATRKILPFSRPC